MHGTGGISPICYIYQLDLLCPYTQYTSMSQSIYSPSDMRAITRRNSITRVVRESIFRERVHANASDDVIGLFSSMGDRRDALEALLEQNRISHEVECNRHVTAHNQYVIEHDQYVADHEQSVSDHKQCTRNIKQAYAGLFDQTHTALQTMTDRCAQLTDELANTKHTSIYIYACSRCEKTFETKMARQKHRRLVHGTKYRSCPKCTYTTKNRSTLFSHMRSVHCKNK